MLMSIDLGARRLHRPRGLAHGGRLAADELDRVWAHAHALGPQPALFLAGEKGVAGPPFPKRSASRRAGSRCGACRYRSPPPSAPAWRGPRDARNRGRGSDAPLCLFCVQMSCCPDCSQSDRERKAAHENLLRACIWLKAALASRPPLRYLPATLRDAEIRWGIVQR